jgi:hypothetical protein
MTEPETYALLFITLGIAALILAFVVRRHRQAVEREERPARDAREYLSAEMRRVK